MNFLRRLFRRQPVYMVPPVLWPERVRVMRCPNPKCSCANLGLSFEGVDTDSGVPLRYLIQIGPTLVDELANELMAQAVRHELRDEE